MSAQGAVWYCTFFYIQTFMEKFSRSTRRPSTF